MATAPRTTYRIESHRRSLGPNQVRRIGTTSIFQTAHDRAHEASMMDGPGAHVIISVRLPGDRWRIVGSYENGEYRAAAT